MSDYGVTPAGFALKPRDVIRKSVVEGIKNIESLSASNTDDIATFEGGLTEMVTESLRELWELAKATYDSGFTVTATGNSFDKALMNLLQARLPEARSRVPLRLFNRTEESPVPVPAESLVRQSATSVLWETLEDAEIPALTVLVAADVASILWQSENTLRLTFESVDLTGVSVGDELTISESSFTSNNGAFALTAVDIESSWVEYVNLNRSSATGDEADSPATAEIKDTETFIDVLADSRNPGPFEASIGSINTVVTGIAGFDGVTNTGLANVGRYLETESEALIRISASLAVAEGATVNAIINNLNEVLGVDFTSVKVNRTGSIVDGLKANSYAVTVTGGAHQDIINAIGSAVAGGLDTNGDIHGVYYDTNGEPHDTYYSRATELNPYLSVTMTRFAEGFPSDAAAQIRAALNALVFGRGDDLYNYVPLTAIGKLGLPGVTGYTVTQGLTEDPEDTAPIVIDADEVINITEDRVTVNFVDA